MADGSGSKLGRFICAQCQAINVQMGVCKKCGADLETGEMPDVEGAQDHGQEAHSLREMQSPGMFSKRQLMFGGAGALLVVSALMMMMGGNSGPAPEPGAADQTQQATNSDGTAKQEGNEDGANSAKAKELAARIAGFQETPPQSYEYLDTTAETGNLPSFTMASKVHNQRITFILWDNPAPFQNLDLVAQGVPFTKFPHIQYLTDIQVDRGEATVNAAPLKWFVGRYPYQNEEGADVKEMTLVGAYQGSDPKKSVVVVARPYDGGDRIDYRSVLWLIDTTTAQAAAQRNAQIKPAAAAETEEVALASEADVDSYRKSLEPLIKAKYNAPSDSKGAKVRVAFSVKQDGSLGKIEITETSGKDECDQALLKAITSAQPFPQPPRTKNDIQATITTDGGDLKLTGS